MSGTAMQWTGTGLLVLFALCVAGPGHAERLSPAKEITWIRVNKELVQSTLRDPASAQFSSVRVSYTSGAPVVCGLVNAKNAFGGYTGNRRFVGAGKTIGTFIEGESEDFAALWNMLC
ncbi:hypothetical protein [Parvibaculum sp.]|uniref:hypothetical protein n=1 Tax=Parvibaculum sp. TaxID=2024848 RepID=UPI001D96D18C|nr:hypothetical protein [Parvibaculum sp.]MBX3490866.1 hypothetical protein [Parvibaculum sp.]